MQKIQNTAVIGAALSAAAMAVAWTTQDYISVVIALGLSLIALIALADTDKQREQRERGRESSYWATVFFLALLALVFAGALLLGTSLKPETSTVNSGEPETQPAQAGEKEPPRAGQDR
jgi:hypothetical protein